MSVDESGNWWMGSNPSDIKYFLEAYASEGYEVHSFRLAECQCGSKSFHLFSDDDEGVAKRICTECDREHFICDSEEFWPDSQPAQWSCIECNSKDANVGVGFSLYDDEEIRWLYVGERCNDCGILGCVAGWKIAYEPSRHLIDQV